MKRVKVLIVLFVCMAVIGVMLVMMLLEKLLWLTAKMLVDTEIAVRRAGIGLCKTACGWLRWAVR